MRRGATAAVALSLVLLGPSCGEGLPAVHLKLSKNCNRAELLTLAAAVGEGPGEEVLHVAADGSLGDRAWILLERDDGGDGQLVVQRVSEAGVEHETLLPWPGNVSPGVSLRPAPDPGQVWVVRREPGLFALVRVAPDDPTAPIATSDDLSSFPEEGVLCDPCDTSDWHRDLAFLPSGPILLSVPPFSTDAGLIVWVSLLTTEGSQIRMSAGHRLNFEPPCEDDSPEGIADCELKRMTLTYPVITVLGSQEDPREPRSVIFGHRSRRDTYSGDRFPLESADVFMVSVFLDDSGIPAGVLRSFSGLYRGTVNVPPSEYSPEPSADPPHGVAVDRFASYGLFSNNGQVARLVQLPEDDPDFEELSTQIPLTTDTQLLQLDRDLALGRIDEDGNWDVNKLFPDDPTRSETSLFALDAPITAVESGGIGTFLLRKDGAAPQVVRLRCADSGDE